MLLGLREVRKAKSLQKSTLMKPDYAEAHYNMGIALDDQGKLEDLRYDHIKSTLKSLITQRPTTT